MDDAAGLENCGRFYEDNESLGGALTELLPRLTLRADRLLWGKLKGDGEIAAQSAVRTYLRRAKDGQFSKIDSQEALCRLLTRITRCKVSRMIKRETKISDESILEDVFDPEDSGRAIEQFPDRRIECEFDMVCEELFDLLPSDTYRSVALMRMSGHTIAEIAAVLDRSERSIGGYLRSIRMKWERILKKVGDERRDIERF